MFLKKIFIFSALVFTTHSNAAIMAQLSSNYHSKEYGDNETTVHEHHLFLGMPVAVKEQLYLGVNVSYTKEEGGVYMDTMEYGPRLNYYINADKTFFLMLAYNVSISGDRKNASGAVSGDGTLKGSGYLAGLGYEFKMNTNFYLGTSIIYHSTSLDSSDASGSKEMDYSTLTPSINFCFRFK